MTEFQEGNIVKTSAGVGIVEIVSKTARIGITSYLVRFGDDRGHWYAAEDLTLVSRPSQSGRLVEVDFSDLQNGDIYYENYKKGGGSLVRYHRFIEGAPQDIISVAQAVKIVKEVIGHDIERHEIELERLSTLRGALTEYED